MLGNNIVRIAHALRLRFTRSTFALRCHVLALHRTLLPPAGRFLQRDPLGIWGDGLNLGNASAYVGHAPTMFLDPWGLNYQLPMPFDYGGSGGGLNPPFGSGTPAGPDLFADWASEAGPKIVETGVVIGKGALAAATLVSPVPGDEVAAAALIGATGAASAVNKLKAVNKLNKLAQKGNCRVSKRVERVEKADPRTGELAHVHFKDGRVLREDGTWRGDKGGTLSNAERNWLEQNGWPGTLPPAN